MCRVSSREPLKGAVSGTASCATSSALAVLVLLLDLAGTGPTPAEQYGILIDELRRYEPELLERPRLVVGSKSDAVVDQDGHAVAAGHRDEGGDAKDHIELVISAVTGAGVDALVGRLATLVTEARAAEDVRSSTIVVYRPVPEGIEVNIAPDGSFEVLGRSALRAVALSDLTDDGAVDYVQTRLRKLGVERALVRAGIREGDVVHLGALTFTYHRDIGGLDATGALAAAAAEGAPRRRARQRKGGGDTSDRGRQP